MSSTMAGPMRGTARAGIIIRNCRWRCRSLRCRGQGCCCATIGWAVSPEQLPLFEAAGWLIRAGTQFHWRNDGYAAFDDFLRALASRKRKAIRKERAAAAEGLEIVHLSGAEITEAHWDAFWEFYQDTGSRKWGRPYLTRAFFSLLGERMADDVLLIFALRDGQPIAGALNLIGADTLYGRYWGCNQEVPFLHFELCYYQAIDAAIARGLTFVEAGAQFVEAERSSVAEDIALLDRYTPFKKG